MGNQPLCIRCAGPLDPVSGTCPVCGPRPAEPVRVRCPYCAESILAAARKCPHCKEILDASLKRQQERGVAQEINRSLQKTEIEEKVLHSVIASAVGMFLFCMIGPLLGPIVLLYARYYRRRAEALGIGAPAHLGTLRLLGWLWFAVGTVAIVLMTVAIAAEKPRRRAEAPRPAFARIHGSNRGKTLGPGAEGKPTAVLATRLPTEGPC
ncbi:MAG: zinc ribbon domain-containing protein [Planctomycetes bacterium]|nr:zinc ribbon domain-containing protein [Planctomycetota bacterium]